MRDFTGKILTLYDTNEELQIVDSIYAEEVDVGTDMYIISVSGVAEYKQALPVLVSNAIYLPVDWVGLPPNLTAKDVFDIDWVQVSEDSDGNLTY